MLILPAKTADPRGARRLEDRDVKGLAADFAALLLALRLGNVDQRRIVNRLDKSVPEDTQRGARGTMRIVSDGGTRS